MYQVIDTGLKGAIYITEDDRVKFLPPNKLFTQWEARVVVIREITTKGIAGHVVGVPLTIKLDANIPIIYGSGYSAALVDSLEEAANSVKQGNRKAYELYTWPDYKGQVKKVE